MALIIEAKCLNHVVSFYSTNTVNLFSFIYFISNEEFRVIQSRDTVARDRNTIGNKKLFCFSRESIPG